jgi:hypothetical protein
VDPNAKGLSKSARRRTALKARKFSLVMGTMEIMQILIKTE